MDKIGIIGTGLIGTSLGLAIKQAGVKTQIVGTDRERSHASKAKMMGAVDEVTGRLAGAAEDAKIVIIATPVTAMKEIMEIIGPRLMEGCLVTDTGGSKGVVIEWAEQYLPRSVSFVGGHPLVSKENSGPEAADRSLFKDRPYCVIPGSRARQDAVRQLTDLILAIGGKPYFMDVAEHDSFVSAVSHLPLLLSVALMSCTSKSPSWYDISKIASTQYRAVTSLASTDPVTSRDLFLSNNQGTVDWIDAFIQELYEIRQILTSDDDGKLEALQKVFSEALLARNRWLADAVTPGSPDAMNRDPIPSATERMADLFMGDSQARRRIFRSGRLGDKDTRGKR